MNIQSIVDADRTLCPSIPRLSAMAPLAVLALVAACGGQGARADAGLPPSVDASTDARGDAMPELPGDALTACQQQHLVCGRIGTESCGTCDFAASCLPDQTGCVEDRPVRIAVSSFTNALDMGDRLIALGPQDGTGHVKSVVEVLDSGTGTTLDFTEDVQSITDLARNSTAPFWVYDNGTVRFGPAGSDMVYGLTTVPGSCSSFAVTDQFLVCALHHFLDSSLDGIYRYSVGDPTMTMRIADSNLLTMMATHGDTLYYANFNAALHAISLTTAVEAPVSDLLPSSISIIYGVTGDDVIVGTMAASGPEIWRMSLDGATAERVVVATDLSVIGVTASGLVVRKTTGTRPIGQLAVRSGQLETLIAAPDYDIQLAVPRDHGFLFAGMRDSAPQLTRLTR